MSARRICGVVGSGGKGWEDHHRHHRMKGSGKKGRNHHHGACGNPRKNHRHHCWCSAGSSGHPCSRHYPCCCHNSTLQDSARNRTAASSWSWWPPQMPEGSSMWLPTSSPSMMTSPTRAARKGRKHQGRGSVPKRHSIPDMHLGGKTRKGNERACMPIGPLSLHLLPT